MNKGQAFLLKIKVPNNGVVYQTVGGMRINTLSIRNEVVEEAPTSLLTGWKRLWRTLVDQTGRTSVGIVCGGIFMGSSAEAKVRANALAGTFDQYELSFDDGTRLRGTFLIAQLNYAGDFNGERNYTMQLESSGHVEVV